MNWIFSPIVPLTLFVLLIFVQLGLFLALKREQAQIRTIQNALDRKWSDLHGIQQTALERVASEIQALQETQPSVSRAAGFSMNLTRRQQVIQMARKGTAPASIASTLQIPKREVELLLKVLKGLPPPV